MTTLADLKAAYDSTLSGHAPVVNPSQANDAYELYAFTLLLRAAQAEGCSLVTFATTSGTSSPTVLRFRTSPGSIYSLAHDYCHANVSFPAGLAYEVHIGVYVAGVAGVLHECDVAVIKADEAAFCRRNRVHPKRASVLIAGECKFYTGNLGIGLGREFLGATTDLSVKGRFLLSNSDGNSIDRVLAHHDRRRQFKLSPLDPSIETQAIAQFKQIFHDELSSRR